MRAFFFILVKCLSIKSSLEFWHINASQVRLVVSNVPQSDNIAFTGKSLSEALIFASTNPQYDDRLFIELQVQ